MLENPWRFGLLCIGLFAGAWLAIRLGGQMIADERAARITAMSVIKRAEKSIVNLPVLQFSASLDVSPGNRLLRDCLDSTSAEICTTTDPHRQVAFVAALPGKAGEHLALAGTRADRPVYYSRGGTADCASRPSVSACPGWQLLAFFWADCAGATRTCEQAIRIHVRLQLVPVDPALARHGWPEPEYMLAEPTAFAKSVKIRTRAPADSARTLSDKEAANL